MQRLYLTTCIAGRKFADWVSGKGSRFPHVLDEAETAPGRVGDASVGEPPVRLLEQLPPVADVALAAVETGCHDQVRVSGKGKKKDKYQSALSEIVAIGILGGNKQTNKQTNKQGGSVTYSESFCVHVVCGSSGSTISNTRTRVPVRIAGTKPWSIFTQYGSLRL